MTRIILFRVTWFIEFLCLVLTSIFIKGTTTIFFEIIKKTQDGGADGKKRRRRRGERELKYEMHLALAQYNGPAFFSPPPLYPKLSNSCFYRQVAGILIVSHRRLLIWRPSKVLKQNDDCVIFISVADWLRKLMLFFPYYRNVVFQVILRNTIIYIQK